jgi:D-alanyl-D-alanine carboxypeptidase/D-alanyl-D-alanine-endopeptidase (penicillin-binding protein 4)
MTFSATPPKRVSKKALIVTISGVLAGLLAISGSFSVGLWAQASEVTLLGVETTAVEDLTLQDASVRPAPSAALAARRIPTCSINDLALDPALGSFSGIVMDPISGEIVFSRLGEVGIAPASVMKVITASAALTTLGPDATFTTSVVASPDAETVVLVGGGDSTLTARAPGAESVYVGSPTLADLAEQTIASWSEGLEEGTKVAITELVVDASLWDPEDSWDSTWSTNAKSSGFISEVTALQVDGDRRDPAFALSPRTNDPVARAASAFVSALRAAGNTSRFVNISYGIAGPDARVLASVESRPVSELVTYMLKESDNTLAEMLARHVSLAAGFEGTSESIGQALTGSLAPYGLDSELATIRDGSGLSPENLVTPWYVGQLLVEAYRSETELLLIPDALPLAGVDGSLDDRFTGANAIAQAQVRAKTGSITGVRSLAGFVTGEDGADLVFAFFAVGDVGDAAKMAIDTVVTGVYSCGSNLADF